MNEDRVYRATSADVEKQRDEHDFYDLVTRCMSDEDLGPISKLVMITYFMGSVRIEGMMSDLQICHLCNITMEQFSEAQRELMAHDWLAAPMSFTFVREADQ